MQMMSNFQSEVSNRLAVLERRENFQQTVLTGVENPKVLENLMVRVRVVVSTVQRAQYAKDIPIGMKLMF